MRNAFMWIACTKNYLAILGNIYKIRCPVVIFKCKGSYHAVSQLSNL